MLNSNQLVKGFIFSLYDEKYEVLGYQLKDDLLVVKSLKDLRVSTVPRLLVIISGKDLFDGKIVG